MKKHLPALTAIGILVFVAMACSGSFTTANISSFNFGKTESADPTTTAFDVGEKIYAVATVSNTSSKHKIIFKVLYENVAGKGQSEEALNKDIEFEGSRPITLNFTAPLAGEYKVEAALFDEQGKEIDKKSGTVTVKGGNAAPRSTDTKKKKADDSDDQP